MKTRIVCAILSPYGIYGGMDDAQYDRVWAGGS